MLRDKQICHQELQHFTDFTDLFLRWNIHTLAMSFETKLNRISLFLLLNRIFSSLWLKIHLIYVFCFLASPHFNMLATAHRSVLYNSPWNMPLLHQKQNSLGLLWKSQKMRRWRITGPCPAVLPAELYPKTIHFYLIPILLLEGQKDLYRSLKGGVGGGSELQIWGAFTVFFRLTWGPAEKKAFPFVSVKLTDTPQNWSYLVIPKKQKNGKQGGQFISTGVKYITISDAPLLGQRSKHATRNTAALLFKVQVHVTLSQLLNRQQCACQHRE